MKPYQFCVLVALLGGYVAIEKEWLPWDHAAAVPVDQTIVQAATTAGSDYLLGLAEQFDKAANDAEKGSTPEKLHKTLTDENRTVRKNAFKPIDEVFQRTSPANLPSALKSVANGLRKAAKGK